jgi:hypothetical protein
MPKGGVPVRPRAKRSKHALFPKDLGPLGEPFLPAVGELYLIDTAVYTLGIDPAANRRAVVITVPAISGSKAPVQVVTRTSQDVPGVGHPADLSIVCDLDGVFSDLVSIEQQTWRPGNVLKLGDLPEPYRSRVLERFS